jgi:hypothetical protein
MTENKQCTDSECNGEYCYGFNCWDCNFNTMHGDEYYMVATELWELATIYAANDNQCDTHVMLCIGCLENRIGGVLTPSDFPDYPINRGVFPMSPRLKNRVTGVY